MSRSLQERKAVLGDWLEEQGYVVSRDGGYVVFPPCEAVTSLLWDTKEEAVHEAFECVDCFDVLRRAGAPVF